MDAAGRAMEIEVSAHEKMVASLASEPDHPRGAEWMEWRDMVETADAALKAQLAAHQKMVAAATAGHPQGEEWDAWMVAKNVAAAAAENETLAHGRMMVAMLEAQQSGAFHVCSHSNDQY